MYHKYILFILSFVLLLPHSLSAAVYTGTWYTVDLWAGKWQRDTHDESVNYDTFRRKEKIIQIFEPDASLYRVLTWTDKKAIASLFQVYRDTIDSSSTKKEVSRVTKTGKIHYMSLTIPTQDGNGYVAFCIASNTKAKMSVMMNIVTPLAPVSQLEIIKICSSIQPESAVISGVVSQ